MAYWYYIASCLLLATFLWCDTEACWGSTSPGYGEMTGDYDLLVGGELVLNCVLKAQNFPDIPDKIINSSDLIFEKGDLNFSSYTRKLDHMTLQLKIPKAEVNDSGFYYCKILLANGTKPVVCGSKISVGTPPKPVTNFTCISRNFDDLLCSWDAENTNVQTKYTIVKSFMNEGFQQKCPDAEMTLNSCNWTSDSDPSYIHFNRNVSFSLIGINSLGSQTDNFTLDTYAIVIPNSPEDFRPIHVGNQSISVGWKPPKMRDFSNLLKLQFQVWIGKLNFNSTDIQIYDAGIGTSEYTLEGLIPHISYNVSIRCRSIYAEKDLWSQLVSTTIKTLPDVPYLTPEIIPEAYEFHIYDSLRSVTLYWKTVPELFHNGDNFHYHIKYFKSIGTGISSIFSMNSSVPFLEIKKLRKSSPYTFHVYSANQEGISEKFESIFVDVQDKIISGPKEIRAISQDIGHYNLSWNTPDDLENVSYTVFWCSSLKPWVQRCDSQVEWINENLMENNVILNLTDVKTNFQFAVVSKTENSISGMQWASCIVPHKAALRKIRHVVLEPKTSTSLKVIWNLDCDAQKAVVDRYEIIYCRLKKDEECKVATVNDSNAKGYLLEHLHPFSRYSVKIRAFNKDNLPSEDSDAREENTLPGAPSGPPQHVNAVSRSNSSFYVSWTAPLEPNGRITTYIVSYNDSQKVYHVTTNDNTFSLVVDELKPFTKYAVRVEACVKGDCSVKSDPVMVLTEVGGS